MAMTIQQKLKRLLEDRVHTRIASKSGIHVSTLTLYLKKGARPGSAVAVRLARTLGVDPGWLIDDSKGWPPIRVDYVETPAA